MTRPLDTKRPAPATSGLGSIRADEILPYALLGQRFGFGKKFLIQLQRQGLKTIKVGHRRFCFGRDVLAFFDGLAERQAGRGET
jgi:hypothetical protein